MLLIKREEIRKTNAETTLDMGNSCTSE